MLTEYLKRGIKAGAVGGLIYGLYVALVGNNLIAYAESFERNHAHSVGEAVAMAGELTAPISVVAGILWGVFLGGIVFGLVYYFLEPAIPGDDDTKSYLLGAAGFVTISGAPWLVLPPQPPGVEQALPTETRLLLYGGMMVASALVWGFAGVVYNRLRDQGRMVAIRGSIVALALFAIPIFFAPLNVTTGPAPEQFVSAFQWVTVFGQFTLWAVMTGGYVWFARRADDTVHLSSDTTETVENPNT